MVLALILDSFSILYGTSVKPVPDRSIFLPNWQTLVSNFTVIKKNSDMVFGKSKDIGLLYDRFSTFAVNLVLAKLNTM